MPDPVKSFPVTGSASPLQLQTPAHAGQFYPSREAFHWIRVNTTMTGDISASANMASLWVPQVGSRFLLRGLQLSIIVTTTLAAAGPEVLLLVDGTDESTSTIGTLGEFQATSAAGFRIFSGERIYGEGIPSSTRDNVLRLGSNISISTGVIRVAGVIWGDELVK